MSFPDNVCIFGKPVISRRSEGKIIRPRKLTPPARRWAPHRQFGGHPTGISTSGGTRCLRIPKWYPFTRVQVVPLRARIDTRVKTSVVRVGPLGFAQEQWRYFNPYHFARDIGNRPFLMLMGRSDPFYTVEQVEQMYDLIESSPKELVWYDSGHMLPDEWVVKAVRWFEKHLK